jgi:phage terminase small subunit
MHLIGFLYNMAKTKQNTTKKDKLTDKQEKFCQFVAEGDTYADAYRKSYNAKKMGVNTIYVKSSELMNNGKVTVMIAELKKAAIKRNEITIDQVLEQLKNWLLFDPLDIVDEETESVKSLKDMSKEARMSLSEIHVQEIWGNEENPDGKKIRQKIGELKKIKFIDKRATADMFMKKFGEYIEKNQETSSQLDAIKEIINAIKK